MRFIFPIDRKRGDAERGRLRKWAREKAERSHSSLQSTDHGILVVDKTGKIAPLNQGFSRRWRIPRAGKTLPLNQRFAQMWEVPKKLLERLALENGLRQALDREQMAVYSQPQATVETGRIVGMEALVRWEHPDRGLVSPAEFIPLAEDTGLIVRLGEWVLRTACAQNKARREAGLPPLPVAVNLSARQFQQPNLIEMVAGVLKETRLDPESLELEITESTAMQNADFTISVLRDLREMGIRISVDDFGVGYSSLGYLKDFPIHTLKIDRSLVRGVTRESSCAAITTAIIAMASSLNLDVVAEGVETEAQLAFLREHQCDRFQGYLLGKPMPAEEFDTMLRQRESFQGQRREGSRPDPPFFGLGRSATG